jgi:hypothetical protein
LKLSVAVSERLDPDNDAVLEPNTLHQLIGAEIVRPHFYLDFKGGAGYRISLAERGSSRANVLRFMFNLGRVTAFGGNFRAAGSRPDDLACASNRLRHHKRWYAGQDTYHEPLFHLP